MKTSIKSLFAFAFASIILTTSAFAADNAQNVTQLNDIKNVNKIKVSGNVELILVQSPVESVKVYDDYYAKNALVQQKNNSLFISSFDSEKLTVVVYVNNLSEVTATDNASVSTFGKLRLLSLDVKLQNKATADLNLNAVMLHTTVSGASKLILQGSAVDVTANVEQVAGINMDKFVADSTYISSRNAIAKNVETDPVALNLGK